MSAVAPSSPTPAPDADSTPTQLPLDVLLKAGEPDLQLIFDDGQLTVHSQILVTASPDVLAGMIEAAQCKVVPGAAGCDGSSASYECQVPSIKVCNGCGLRPCP